MSIEGGLVFIYKLSDYSFLGSGSRGFFVPAPRKGISTPILSGLIGRVDKTRPPAGKAW